MKGKYSADFMHGSTKLQHFPFQSIWEPPSSSTWQPLVWLLISDNWSHTGQNKPSWPLNCNYLPKLTWASISYSHVQLSLICYPGSWLWFSVSLSHAIHKYKFPILACHSHAHTTVLLTSLVSLYIVFSRLSVNHTTSNVTPPHHLILLLLHTI